MVRVQPGVLVHLFYILGFTRVYLFMMSMAVFMEVVALEGVCHYSEQSGNIFHITTLGVR